MVLHYKKGVITCHICTHLAIFDFCKMACPSVKFECVLEHEFRTQISAQLNSNGPSALYSEIQMSAVRGQGRCSNTAPMPIPPFLSKH